VNFHGLFPPGEGDFKSRFITTHEQVIKWISH
jgi:hypothetical protein